MRMRELFVALLLLPGSVSAEPLSLKDAVQRGVDHNIDLAVQQIELALAQDARDRAWSAYEPRLDAGISRSSDLDNYADPDDPITPRWKPFLTKKT